jgi:hypothetical protein
MGFPVTVVRCVENLLGRVSIGVAHFHGGRSERRPSASSGR